MSFRARLVLALAFAALFFLANQAFAQSTDSCSNESGSWYKFNLGGGGICANFGGPITGAPSRSVIASAAQSAWCGASPSNSHCLESGSWSITGTGGTMCIRDGAGHCLNTGCVSRTLQTDPVSQCPDLPDPVTCILPPLPNAGIANFAPTAEELDPISCDVVSHCLVSKRPGTTTCSSSTCGAVYSYTDIPGGGVACDGLTVPADDTPPELADPEGPPAPAERCTTNGGAEYCVQTGGPDGNDSQCGFLNDDFICLDATPAGGCQEAAGGVLCDPSAATPPAPDNGTPGVPATPDGEVDASASNGNTTNNYNYFDNDTVNNSTHGAQTGHPPQGNDQDGDGFTDENEEDGPSGTAGGGLSCEVAPTCEGDQIACAILQQEWRARCPDEVPYAEMLDAIGATPEETGGLADASGNEEVDVGALSSSGIWTPSACPAPLNVTVMGQAISLDVWQGACNMAELFAPFVLAMGYLVAAFAFVGKGQ